MEESGHAVVRWAPYNPELNPVDVVWAKVKNEVADENVANSLVEVTKMIEQKLFDLLQEN